ncbi:MAG: family 43 glycosylhydrolase [Fusicatenibacter sp.]|nr:family 43 glycosylhydrolase [Lachnospiraceae bacterium]MDY2939066.1 family 43 glycosylhydrolase [Fusicatenibacter sp.]
MDGILKLNDYDVQKNPSLGAHDPSMMWDPVTKRYYSYSTDIYQPQHGLNDRIGIPVRSSEDLIHFRYEGTVLSEESVAEGKDNGEYSDTVSFWAPFVEYVNGEYRMYYAATRAFGSYESRIWLAVAKNPLGPFVNRGVVMDSWGTGTTSPNAIDPHVVRDRRNCYLVYGSYFGGIYLKKLDDETGLALSGDPKETGICISRKAPNGLLNGPEGASVIYVPETGYYYLFQSYGWLGSNYDIRVGRSLNVEGPYLDLDGRDLVEESMGLKIANSYQFKAENPNAVQEENGWSWGGFRAPGHGVPFHDPRTGNYFFVHHIRDGSPSCRRFQKRDSQDSYLEHYLFVRPMMFQEGWPVLGPEPYTGEDLNLIPAWEVRGRWEIVLLDDDSNEMKYSREYDLDEYSIYLFKGRVYRCWDFENQKMAVAVTGIDRFGQAYWGKLISGKNR